MHWILLAATAALLCMTLPLAGSAQEQKYTPGGSVIQYQSPAIRPFVPLDIAQVTTGGVAVLAISPGNRTAGGVLWNPTGATVSLCINEFTTAAGTTTGAQGGELNCVVPGQKYVLRPSPLGVSVITSDSLHSFSGYGVK